MLYIKISEETNEVVHFASNSRQQWKWRVANGNQKRSGAGNINVTLRPEATPIQSAQPPIKIETISIPVGVPLELFCLDNTNLDKGYISACAHDPEKIISINGLTDKIKDLKSNGIAGSYCSKIR